MFRFRHKASAVTNKTGNLSAPSGLSAGRARQGRSVGGTKLACAFGGDIVPGADAVATDVNIFE
jgi:hypothetical protein